MSLTKESGGGGGGGGGRGGREAGQQKTVANDLTPRTAFLP